MHSITESDKFRAALRVWLENNCPPEMRDRNSNGATICWGGKRWEFESQAQKDWLERCAAQGLTVPTWPRAYGGAGLDRAGPGAGKGVPRRNAPHRGAFTA